MSRRATPIVLASGILLKALQNGYRCQFVRAQDLFDDILAAGFYQRHIPLDVIQNAFVLGAVRRLYRDPDDLPLPPVRSLRYFCGLVEEVFQLKTHPKTKSAYFGYFQYLRYKIKTFDCDQFSSLVLEIIQAAIRRPHGILAFNDNPPGSDQARRHLQIGTSSGDYIFQVKCDATLRHQSAF